MVVLARTQEGMPNRHRPLVALGILLGVASIASVVWRLTEREGLTFGAQIAAALIALFWAVRRAKVYWGISAAIAGCVAGLGLWVGVHMGPSYHVETLTTAELPGRLAWGFFITDGRVLLDQQTTISVDEEEGCHQSRGDDCSVTYDYVVAPVVSSAWREGNPVSAWITDKRARREQTIGVWPRPEARDLPMPPLEWTEQLTSAIRRGPLSVEDGASTSATLEQARRAVSRAEKERGLTSAAGAPLLRFHPDPNAAFERELRLGRWALRGALGIGGLCALAILGSFLLARARQPRTSDGR